jgi:lysozyme
MIDLSNNNGTPNFQRIYEAGHRRVLLKLAEGSNFVDHKYGLFRTLAHRAGLRTGAYYFAHPQTTDPRVSAGFFLRLLGRHLRPGYDLRPVLDLEYSTPSPAVGRWATTWIKEVRRVLGVTPIIYSYASYLEGCKFSVAPAPLWLASYGRNDGVEHPFSIPHPWTEICAHQFSSEARVAGVPGRVDISKVFNGRALEVPAR